MLFADQEELHMTYTEQLALARAHNINIAKDNITGELGLIKRLIDDERNASEETRRARQSMTNQYLENLEGLISRTFATLENGDNIK